MQLRYSPSSLRSAGSVAWLAILVVLAVSCLALVGWALDVAVLKSVAPEWMAMSVVTAICLILSAVAGALLLNGPSAARKSVVMAAPAVVVCLVGLVTVALYAVAMITGRDPNLENIPFMNIFWVQATRPALLTAILFVIAGSALLLLARGGRRASDIAHGLALPGVVLSYLVPVSYVLGVEELHQLWNIPVALNTGIAFCALFLAILCARPDTWLMSVLTGDHAGCVMARRMLPAILAGSLLIGWAHLYGERSGTILSESGGALVVVVFTFLLLWLMWLSAASINRADIRVKARAEELEREVAERKSAEQALRDTRDKLTELVAERTAELVLVNAHLEDEMKKREGIQRETDATNLVLRLMVDASGRQPFLDGLVDFLREWTGCSCAGIRIVGSDRFVPYESYLGFTLEFWQKENFLSSSTDICACTRVVLGKPEPQDLPCMSAGGSFVLNDSMRFLETLSSEEVKRFRGLCIRSGFKSIAIIPVRDEERLIGVLHLADEREGQFPAPLICSLEKLSGLIDEGLRKFKMQDALVSNMAKLEALNEDLQEFAFIASHDLREPLRKIRAFGDLLCQKYEEALGEKGRDYLHRMIDASGRMSELIEALTRYSRVTTRTNPVVPTDLCKVVRDVVSDLELVIKRKGVEVEIGDLPTVDADLPQMRQLFQNLIANAIKYQPEGNKPVIKIHGRTENAICRIFVEDNGIGFRQEQAEKIFKPFERLHGRSSIYQGTGIGLAICRKIVERHGGSITATGSPGEGATFMIRLPVRMTG